MPDKKVKITFIIEPVGKYYADSLIWIYRGRKRIYYNHISCLGNRTPVDVIRSVLSFSKAHGGII